MKARPRRRSVCADRFKETRIAAGFDRHQAAEYLGVSFRTIGHWETGKTRPSYAAFRLLRVLRNGQLGDLDPAWSGFVLRRGSIATPEDHTFTPGDMSWQTLLCRQAEGFRELMRQRRVAEQPASVHVGAEPGFAVNSGCAYNLTTPRRQEPDLFTSRGVQQPAQSGEGPSSNTGQKFAQIEEQGSDGRPQRSNPGGAEAGGDGIRPPTRNQPQRAGSGGTPGVSGRSQAASSTRARSDARAKSHAQDDDRGSAAGGAGAAARSPRQGTRRGRGPAADPQPTSARQARRRQRAVSMRQRPKDEEVSSGDVRPVGGES